GDLLVVLNQTIDLLQQLQGAVGQVLDSRALWQLRDSRGASRRASRAQQEMRLRLENLRESLAEAWRNMLRGSVALSRAIPTLAAPAETPTQTPTGAGELPPIPMAEDEDTGEAWGDRAEDAAGTDADDEGDEVVHEEPPHQ
ncbi:MAG TPA: hypothetical protein VJR48_09285, partial [Ktedonobacterales bacterium]|nr:hypothetical protein [Ktedonobacterales bacterium]